MSSCNPCDENISVILDTGSQGPPGVPGPIADVFNYEFVLLAGDTIISGTDNSGNDFTYNPSSLQVHLNGVLLSKTDYTATDGTSIILNEAAANNNDLAQISTQVKPEGSDDIPSEIDRIDGELSDLDARVTTNEGNIQANADAIEAMQETAAAFTTRDVKVSGVSPTRERGDDLETQQDINYLFDADILANTARLDALESKEPDVKPDDLENLSKAIEENAQGISDNATAIGDLDEAVGDNTDDITALQEQVNKLPPPTDISELEKDVGDISKQLGKNTVEISKHDKRITDLEDTPDIGDVEDAVTALDGRVTANESAIVDLQATDAKHANQIGDLEISVGRLEAIDLPDNYAVVDDDNEFQTPQTIKDGVKLTGSNAFIECDKGTALQVKNGNFSNSVVDIVRSNGSVAISLEASSHIRGVKTDAADPTSAVNVEYVQDLVGDNDHTHDDYATKVDLKTEEQARIIGDEQLGKELQDAIKTQKYDDTAVNNKIEQETAARKSADSSLDHKIGLEEKYRKEEDAKLQDQIDALEIPAVNPELYATVEYVNDLTADFATEDFVEEAIGAIEFPEVPDLPDNLATTEDIAAAVDGLASEAWTTEQIEAIDFPAGTVVSDEAPSDAEEGDLWFDTTRLELFVRYQDAWVTTSPLGVRIDEAEAIQRQIIDQVADSVDKQETLFRTVSERSRIQDALVISNQQLIDKVDALEGSTLDAKFRADPRDNPTVGGFVLQDGTGNKSLFFSQATQIEFWNNDYTGKVVDISKVLNGDILRLVVSPTNYANYTITSVEQKEDTFVVGVEFSTQGSEQFVLDGAVYDFTHATPFNPEAFATKDYVDNQTGTKLSKSGDTMSGVLNMGENYIANVRNPGSGKDAVNRDYVKNGFLGNSGEQILKSSAWKVRAPTTNPDDSGKLSFIDIKDDEMRLYHVANPTDAHHAVPKIYLEQKFAGLETTNTYKEVQTFQKSAYFQNAIILNGKNGDTVAEVRGDNEEMRQLWWKVRGTNRLSFICYPGQENSGYKKCLEMEWDTEKNNPKVALSYLVDPSGNGDAANKRYVDQEIAKVSSGSDGAKAKSGTSTPSLETGELFFNTTDKILYIGE